MKINKKLIVCVVFFFLVTGVVWTSDVDPFYTNLFVEGKSLFKRGEFREAVKSFTIAEFGMLDNKEMVTALRFYMAMTRYKLKQVNLFKEVIKKIELENGWTDSTQMVIPAELKQEMLVILAAYSGITTDKGKANNTKKSKGRQKAGDFNLIFAKGLLEVNQNNLAGLKKTIKNLKRVNKKDPRVDFLEGVLACKKKKYARCIKELLKIENSIPPALKTQVFYYLSLSYFYKNNFGQTLAFYYKIEDQALRSRLSQVIKQVLKVRNGEIEKISRQFSQKAMSKLLKQFPGDSYICTDLLASITRLYKKDSQKVRQILFSCLKFPSAYNQEFILKSVQYLEQLGEIPQAIGLIEECKYIKSKNKQGIEILYKLGELYMNIYEYKKAHEYLLQVNRLQRGFRKTDFYIDRIKKIQYNK